MALQWQTSYRRFAACCPAYEASGRQTVDIIAGDGIQRAVKGPFGTVASSRVCAAGRCEYAGGYSFTTLLCEQRRYLPWLTERALRAGVTLAHRTITSLRARRAQAPPV